VRITGPYRHRAGYRYRVTEAAGAPRWAPSGRTEEEAPVAALVGLGSRQAIQAYECGRVVPQIDTCERLAKALGVRPSWLAGRE